MKFDDCNMRYHADASSFKYNADRIAHLYKKSGMMTIIAIFHNGCTQLIHKKYGFFSGPSSEM